MGQWNDVYFRSNKDDSGECPIGGCLSGCFDIITRNEPLKNPSALIGDDWNKNDSKNLNANMNNYIYVRGKNLAGKKQTGQVYLYYSKAALLLYPSEWEKNTVKTGAGKNFFDYTVDTNSNFLCYDNTQGGFVWNPTMITNDHYCLVSRSVTNDNPAPIPKISDVRDFAKFIANNRSYGWRNVTVVDKDAPTFTKNVYYNQGTEADDIHFILSCKDAPVGAEVSFDCPTPGTNPPLFMNRTKITTANQDIGVVCNVPANYSGTITYNYWGNGGIPGDNFSLTMQGVIFVSSYDELYQYAKHSEELGFLFTKNQLSAMNLNTIEPVRGIILGQYKTEGRRK